MEFISRLSPGVCLLSSSYFFTKLRGYQRLDESIFVFKLESHRAASLFLLCEQHLYPLTLIM